MSEEISASEFITKEEESIVRERGAILSRVVYLVKVTEFEDGSFITQANFGAGKVETDGDHEVSSVLAAVTTALKEKYPPIEEEKVSVPDMVLVGTKDILSTDPE